MNLDLEVTFRQNTKGRIHERNNKLDFITIKICCTKDTVKRMRRHATHWEKTFGKDISDKDLLSKICKEPRNFTIEKKKKPKEPK